MRETPKENVHELLDHMIASQVTPSRLQTAWSTLNWVCKRMGHSPDLKAAYAKAGTQLVKKLYKEPHRATMPTDGVVTALETGSCNTAQSLAYRYYSGTLRTQLGVSARFVDVQHTSPRTYQVMSKDIDLGPWQTKVTHKGVNVKTRYTSTKHTIASAKWWLAPQEACQALINEFPEIDFMYPQLESTKTKLLLQPANYQHAERMFRHILVTEGVDVASASNMSLHSLRLWAAEMAFCSEVPRNLKKYVGRHMAAQLLVDAHARWMLLQVSYAGPVVA